MKYKRYPKYKDSGVEWIGEIPEGWEVKKSKYCISIKNGFPFDSNFFSNDKGMPLLRIRDITSGRLETYFTGNFSDKYLLDNGSLLVGMDGDFNTRWWNGGKFLLNQRCCSLDTYGELDKRFLYFQIPFELKVIQDTKFFTTVKHLSEFDMSNLNIIIPPIEEQIQISEFLDKQTTQFDELIAKSKAQITLLEEKRQALITATVTGKIDVRS